MRNNRNKKKEKESIKRNEKSRWKKRRKKLFQKEVRQLKEASLFLSKPDKRERDREILQQESRERKINTKNQRKFVYDAREPFRKRKNRGKKIPNSNSMTGKNKKEEKEEIKKKKKRSKMKIWKKKIKKKMMMRLTTPIIQNFKI